MILGQQFSRYREKIVTYTNQRIHAFEEFINGCQTIKIYNWEKYIETRVIRIRELELAAIRRTSFLRAINVAVFFAAMPLIGFSTYVGAWFTGRQLKVIDIFITLGFYSQIRDPIMYALPLAIEKFIDLRLAWQRIDRLIQLMIKEGDRTLHTFDIDHYQQKGAITMWNASFSWNGHDDCLSSLNIDIKPGTFVGITGVVGSGKSSLFAAILGEIIQTNGKINVNNSSFSYAAQFPWIFSDTLRANILFEKPYDEQRYRSVIQACCLDIDLIMLGPCGDLTIIGEKGMNLSGGQKARVSLARALYADADIYLLDDPLASLDRIVAKRIYDRCIGPNSLLRNKTRLLITHQTHFLTDTHQTIILVHGHIKAQGRFDELEIEHEKFYENQSKVDGETVISPAMLDIWQSSTASESIIVSEASNSHNVSCSLWYSLFIAPPLRSFGLCFMIILLVIGEILYDGTYLWLIRSSQQSENKRFDRSIGIRYFVLTMAISIVAVGRSSFFFYQLLNGSNHFHNRMLSGLLHTSMRFFESNPSGRILNRVSKDQQVVDEILPATLFDAIQVLIMTIGSVILIIVINPWMILVFIFLGPGFWLLYRYYLRSSQQLQRMESVTRSPIFGLFVSSLNGLATIRAFKAQNAAIRSFMTVVDANARPYLYMAGATRWFCCRIDLMTTLLTLFVGVFVVVLRNKANPELLILSLLYTININNWFQFGMRRLTEAQNLMTSAERIDEYARLSQEEDNGGSKRLIRTPTDWPNRGAIEFRNYSLRYRSNLEPALRNINLAIKPCERIGIMGRTGAGKSSLFQSLLRLVDRSTIDGNILIDDIDISRITLNHLRSHISVIPQQFVLFAGTLRSNIDPLDAYSDEQCWTALEAVQLKSMASHHPAGLLMPVAESGSNLSIGQCQLICVCRAILKSSKILLIDEATANVDNDTDQMLQSIIAEITKNRTVLTIAHRLNTVIGSDRLLAVDNGMIVDFDVPNKVLKCFQ
ncbi:unnamed protein product [Rotaria sp. Silwood1]|nr:unnamed protein product [Rotaria sp. Silwood1]